MQEELNRRVSELLEKRKQSACYLRKKKIWSIRSQVSPNLKQNDEKYLLGCFNHYGTASLTARYVRLRKKTALHKNETPKKCNFFVEYSEDQISWYHFCTNKVHNKHMN